MGTGIYRSETACKDVYKMFEHGTEKPVWKLPIWYGSFCKLLFEHSEHLFHRLNSHFCLFHPPFCRMIYFHVFFSFSRTDFGDYRKIIILPLCEIAGGGPNGFGIQGRSLEGIDRTGTTIVLTRTFWGHPKFAFLNKLAKIQDRRKFHTHDDVF